MENLWNIPRKLSKNLRLAIRLLFQQKLRSTLSALGVVCGVMAVLAMISIGEGAKQETISQIEQLGTKNIYIKKIALTEDQKIKARERLSQGLSERDVQRITAIKTTCKFIDEVACIKEISASILGSTKEFTPQIIATSANYADIHRLSISAGRFISDQDIAFKNLVCVLGSRVAENLGAHGQPGNYMRIEGHLLKIVGILSQYDIKSKSSSVISVKNYNEMIFVPLRVDRSIDRRSSKKNQESKGELTEIIVQASETDHVFKAAAVIKRIMEISHSGVEDYQMVIPQALLRQSQKTSRTFNIVLGAIAGISLLVGGIGIMNIMLATVSERTKEIGIRRAVGATQGDIILQFLTETVLLTFSGGIIGIGAGIGAVWVITTGAGWNTAITFYAIALPLILSISVGIFFGIYPARKASKLDPIAALRLE